MINILMLSNDDLLNFRLKKAFKEFMSDLISFKVTDINNIYEDIKSADLLLIDPKQKDINSKKLPKDCAYSWFSTDKTNRLNNTLYIYMYQNIFGICQSIQTIIKNYKDRIVNKSDFFQNTEIITFISCGGNTGATTISEAFSYNRYYKGNSVLHIVLSPTKKSMHIVDNVARENIYFDENLSELLNSDVVNDLELIDGFQKFHNSLNFSMDNLKTIIEFAKKSEFDFVTIDFELNYVTLIYDTLSVSNRVILVTNGSNSSLKFIDEIIDIKEFYDNNFFKIIYNLCQSNIDYSNYTNNFINVIGLVNTVQNNEIILPNIAKQLDLFEI